MESPRSSHANTGSSSQTALIDRLIWDFVRREVFLWCSNWNGLNRGINCRKRSVIEFKYYRFVFFIVFTFYCLNFCARTAHFLVHCTFPWHRLHRNYEALSQKLFSKQLVYEQVPTHAACHFTYRRMDTFGRYVCHFSCWRLLLLFASYCTRALA